jgi:beta-lactamase regulating signal transducer with metallopeptidase domain
MMHQEITWVNALLAGVVGFAIRASVLLGGAWLVTLAMRRASAASRHLIWTAATAGVLMLPVFAVVVPAWNVVVLPAVVAPSKVAEVASVTAGTDKPAATPGASDGASAAAVAPAPGSDALVHSAEAASPAALPRPTFVDGLARAYAALNARVLFAMAWLALSALLLVRLAIANGRVATWKRISQPVEDASILALITRLCRQYGIQRPVTLLENDRTDVPVTWGIIYPVVLLPTAWARWDDEQRIAVLTHELAHVKRLDAFTQQLAQAMVALLWFNPLVWVAVRRMRLEREHACDDFVLLTGARATRYADELLGLARRLARPTAPAAAALAMARRSELEGRLLAILDPYVRRDAVRRARVAVVIAAVVVLATPLAAFTAVRESAPAGSGVATALARPSIAAPPPVNPSPASTSMVASARDVPSTGQPAAPDPLPANIAALLPPVRDASPAMSRMMLVRADTDPVRPIDLETLIAVTNAAKRMTADSEKGQLLALIAKRYQRNDALRDAYLDAVTTMSSDDERSKALLALLERDSLPRGAVAQVLRATAVMSSDMSKGAVLQRISPAIYADTAVQHAYLDAITGMTSDAQRGAALSTLLKQPALTAQMQLALLDAIAPMSSDAEKASALTLFIERQGLSDDRVRRVFFRTAETLTSDADYRRLMTAVMK